MQEDEMHAWLNFDDNNVGNIINWNNATITAVNLTEEEVTKEDLMREFKQKSKYQIIVLQKKKTFVNAVEMCKSMGGELAVPNDNVKFSEFSEVIIKNTVEIDHIN